MSAILFNEKIAALLGTTKIFQAIKNFSLLQINEFIEKTYMSAEI